MFDSKLQLYNHNLETYENIKKEWKKSNKVAVVQATGTGKTYVILRVLEDFANAKTLVLAPTYHILNHIRENNIVNHNTEYMTYTKLSYMTAEEISKLEYDLIIVDEFHRCGAKQWGRAVKLLFAVNSKSKILGTTATHIRYLDKSKDMAEELFDNYIATKIDLIDAINKELLPLPMYVGALYDYDKELNNMRDKIKKSKNSQNQKLELLKKLDDTKNWSLSNGVPKILEKYITEDKSKFIVFCKNKNHLDILKSLMQEWFKQSNISRPLEIYSK